MKTIKVIDLLNKIANGEDVPRYVHNGGIKYVYENNGEYVNIPTGDLLFDFPDDRQLKDYLNDEMEIIEEDNKIEKIIPTSLKGIDDLDEKIEVAHIDTISAIDKIQELENELKGVDK